MRFTKVMVRALRRSALMGATIAATHPASASSLAPDATLSGSDLAVLEASIERSVETGGGMIHRDADVVISLACATVDGTDSFATKKL